MILKHCGIVLVVVFAASSLGSGVQAAKAVDKCASQKRDLKAATAAYRTKNAERIAEERKYSVKLRDLQKALGSADEHLALVKASIAKTKERIDELEGEASNLECGRPADTPFAGPCLDIFGIPKKFRHDPKAQFTDKKDKEAIENEQRADQDYAEIERLKDQISGDEVELAGAERQHEKLKNDIAETNDTHKTQALRLKDDCDFLLRAEIDAEKKLTACSVKK